MGTIAAGFQHVGVIWQFGVSSGENLVWLLGVSAFTRQGGREPETSYWRSLWSHLLYRARCWKQLEGKATCLLALFYWRCFWHSPLVLSQPPISLLIQGRSYPCQSDGSCCSLSDVNPVISQTTWDFETAECLYSWKPCFKMLCKYKNNGSYWHLNSFLCNLCDKLPLVGCYFSGRRVRAVFSWRLGITSCLVRKVSSSVFLHVCGLPSRASRIAGDN